MQVAPRPQPGLSIRDERWDADTYHYCYVDHYRNRCERFQLISGAATVTYEAQVVVARPADVIMRDASETPVTSLPDEVSHLCHAQAICLPDELGHDAWQRFGGLTTWLGTSAGDR